MGGPQRGVHVLSTPDRETKSLQIMKELLSTQEQLLDRETKRGRLKDKPHKHRRYQHYK